MAYLTDKETEFYKWLDQCPVRMVCISEFDDLVTYSFYLEEETDDA